MKPLTIIVFVLLFSFLLSVSPINMYQPAAKATHDSGVTVTESSGDPVDWWTTFHHDLVHSGYSTSTAPNTNQTLWTYRTHYASGNVSTGVESSPSVANGVVFIGSNDFNVYALNGSTSAPLWSYKTGGPVVSSPAVAGGVVYVGSYDDNVYALNASTGTLIWNYTTGSVVYSSPAVAGGMVYVGSYDDNVYALNASTGTLVWNYTTRATETGSGVDSSPAVAGGIVYVGSEDGSVYALNASTGALVWTYLTGNGVDSSPAVAGGIVYVGSEDGSVYALNASTGGVIWSYVTGSSVESSPAVAGGMVYIGSDDDNVYALNAFTGAFVWNYTTGNIVYSSPAVAGGVVYVGSFDDNVYALNASTGALIWICTTGSVVRSSPAIADGVVYVGSDDCYVYAFGVGTIFPWVGVGVALFPNGSLQSVSCSNYVYVSHGWVTGNWSTQPFSAQMAFLDPSQTNFTLETNASGFTNPPLSQFTYYNSTDDTMSSWFWIQFYPLNFGPGAYSFTGTWQEAGAANPPNYTVIYQQNTVTLVVNQATPTISISLSSNAVSVGTPVNCSAEVFVLNGTGTINWTTSSSTGYFSPTVSTMSSGNWSTEFFTTTYNDNNTGYVAITATYSGDLYNLPSSGNTTLTVYINVTTGTNVTVTPANNITLTFGNVTSAGTVVANATPTVQAPPLDLIAPYYNIRVTANFTGNVTVSVAFDGSGMTQQQKENLTMNLYTPIIGNIVPPWGTVNMRDVAYIARHFGTNSASPNWDPVCDLNGDGKVDMKDIALVARHFGFTATWVNITTYVDTTNNIIYGTTTHFSLIGIH